MGAGCDRCRKRIQPCNRTPSESSLVLGIPSLQIWDQASGWSHAVQGGGTHTSLPLPAVHTEPTSSLGSPRLAFRRPHTRPCLLAAQMENGRQRCGSRRMLRSTLPLGQLQPSLGCCNCVQSCEAASAITYWDCAIPGCHPWAASL